MNGLYWWFPEENGNGPNKSILNGWLNRGLWDNDSHRALPALYELKAFADDPSAIVPFLNDRVGERDDWYTLQGLRLPSKPSRPGLYINGGRKVLLR